MCKACHKHSLEEIQDSILAQYEFSICRQCIVEYRRLSDIQEQLEMMIYKHVEKSKQQIKEWFYIHNKHKE